MLTPDLAKNNAMKRWTPEYVALLFMSGGFPSIADSYNAESKRWWKERVLQSSTLPTMQSPKSSKGIM
jgi:hypothetical protein